MHAFAFFFEDFAGKNKAPEDFIVGILTQLTMSLYRPGDIILRQNEKVEDLILIEKGSCNLYGFQKYEGEIEKLLIAKLIEFGWYGDYHILLEVESKFELEAGKISK